MFATETYVNRRAALKKSVESGVMLFFGLNYTGLAAVIDIDEDKEIIFGNELTIDYWKSENRSLR